MAFSFSTRARPLLPGRWRTTAIASIVVSVTAFTVLATAYRSQESAGRVDTLIANMVTEDTAPQWTLAHDITMLGTPWAVVAMSGLLMLVAAGVRSGWRAVVLAATGAPAAALLAELALKPLVGRRLRGDLAFPSGHATGVAAVATVAVVILVAGRVGARTAQVATSLIAAATVVAVGASLVVLDHHYATDVVGGALTATATVCALALLLDRGTRGGDVRAGPPPQEETSGSA